MMHSVSDSVHQKATMTEAWRICKGLSEEEDSELLGLLASSKAYQQKARELFSKCAILLKTLAPFDEEKKKVTITHFIFRF
jgi:hypothetical protein